MDEAKNTLDAGEVERNLVLIAGVDSRRQEIHVLKPGEDGIETAVLRPVEHGQTLTGDLVRLHPHKNLPMVAELETVLRHPDSSLQAARSHKGPAMVASEAYRRGWDAVFGTRPAGPSDVYSN
jgi:hypothetical protein